MDNVIFIFACFCIGQIYVKLRGFFFHTFDENTKNQNLNKLCFLTVAIKQLNKYSCLSLLYVHVFSFKI